MVWIWQMVFFSGQSAIMVSFSGQSAIKLGAWNFLWKFSIDFNLNMKKDGWMDGQTE